MKTIITLLLASLMFSQTNLLPNPGFENSLAGWTTRGPADFAVDTVQKHGGAKSARINMAGGTTLNYQQIYCIASSAITEGEKYSASVWVLSQNVTTFPGAYFYIEFQDYAGARVGIINKTNPITAGASGWEELRIDSALVPAGAVKLQIGFILHAIGTAWFDDASVTLVKAAAVVDTAVITVDTTHPACKAFTGFGAEWDSNAEGVYGVTDSDFQNIIKPRVEYMRLPVARIMMMLKYGYQNGGGFDYESADMKRLYRHLDVCQSIGSTVLLTDWGVEKGWTVPTGSDITMTNDTLYASVIGNYLDYLINTKGYNCIKYFILVNEPNYEVGVFSRWAQGVTNVAAAITKRGLQDKVKIAGSDMSNGDDWHTQAVDQLKNTLGSYDFHRYASGTDILSGALENYIRGKWDYALAHDTAAYRKLFIIGEAGLSDGMSTGQNTNIETYDYGVIMTDYALQSARGGSGAVAAWMLDDNSHVNFTWGMWRNKTLGYGLKQWFYPWALLCRYFPAGATTYSLNTGISGFRGIISKNNASTWTLCLVNRTNRPRTAKVTFPDGGTVRLAEYCYSPSSAVKDANGFPLPLSTFQASLDTGLYLTCPANAMVLATNYLTDTLSTRFEHHHPVTPATVSVDITATPNPFNPSTTIRFSLPTATTARYILTDIRGTLIRSFDIHAANAKTGTLVWDGRDNQGRALAAGIYMGSLVSDAGTLATHRLILVK